MARLGVYMETLVVYIETLGFTLYFQDGQYDIQKFKELLGLLL